MTKLKEDDEAAIKKPIPQRSGLSHHKSFLEWLLDSVKDSSPADVSKTAVIAIRPKTVGFKPTGKMEMLAQKSNATSNLVYKPIAKFVTSATLSVLESLGNSDINPRQEIAEVDSCIKTPESNKSDVQVCSEEGKPLLRPSNKENRASSDGHSWRKYGQRQVKRSEYPRSYYKCTYPNCLAKKIVERTFDDQIAEVVFKSEHNHSKPQGPTCDAARIEVNILVSNNQKAYRVEGPSTGSKDQISIKSFGPQDFLGVSPRINEPVVDILFDTRLGNGDINPRQEIAEVDSCIKTPESNKSDVQVYSKEGKTLLRPSNNENRASSDGHSWRKYGQRQVKRSEYPRSYYKCTYPNCLAKKIVERTFDDQIAEVVFKSEHNHSKPQGPTCDAARIEVNSLVSNNQKAYRVEGPSTESKDQISIESFGPQDFLGVSPRINEPVVDILFDTSASTSIDAEKGECEEGSPVALGAEDDGFKSKRRKCESASLIAGSEEKAAFQPGNDAQSNTDSEIIGDGFRWRKYGQKVVKGNSHPRSYYKCTSPKCNVRKYVERTSEDPATFTTTYEGRHNHEMPIKFANSEASNTRTRNKS